MAWYHILLIILGIVALWLLATIIYACIRLGDVDND